MRSKFARSPLTSPGPIRVKLFDFHRRIWSFLYNLTSHIWTYWPFHIFGLFHISGLLHIFGFFHIFGLFLHRFGLFQKFEMWCVVFLSTLLLFLHRYCPFRNKCGVYFLCFIPAPPQFGLKSEFSQLMSSLMQEQGQRT